MLPNNSVKPKADSPDTTGSLSVRGILMVKLLNIFLGISALVGLTSCKQDQTRDSGDLSITARGQIAGKWLGTLTIGGDVGPQASELLAKTLKGFFLSERGGSYTSAFDLSDKSGWNPSKTDVIEKFSALRKSISEFKAKNPSSPTMVALGITGHGFSQDTFSQLSEGFVFAVKQGKSSIIPEEYFSGRELAEMISSLGAEEVLVFVQSCNSGRLSNVDVMNKYALTLANETARRNTNIAVITPVSEFIFSPTEGIELAYQKAFERLAKENSDVVTYATFKDKFVRAVCEDERYYPRREIKNSAAVKASVDLYDVDTLMGIDPQFYESIDPTLPLLLTNTGISKYRNGSLKLPAKQPPVTHVPISAETRQFCESQIAKRAKTFANWETIREQDLTEAKVCYSKADKEACLKDLRSKREASKRN